ncbi:sterol desaturase family protein [Pseudonocardia eucalypti]|uniref:Sterol desaturase family protein n=1 Tax=Pseudonocardia eucalypti TaxID=648755 RepID=A0ABP9PTM9_9PSEU|nr:sterol desaturase/sphingolipid hydroxylase (fatty acid hydroxylase superfamily) [Pseudonocardia eucalypti]
MLDSILAQLHDPVSHAAPVFVLLIVVEMIALRHPDPDHPPPRGYQRPDTRTSLLMGLIGSGVAVLFRAASLVGYSAVYVYLAPWHLPADAWWTWAILLLGVDFLWYWYHRLSHRVRIVWAAHQAHHSSEYFNYSTALRQKWNLWFETLIWLPLPLLGMPPALVYTGFSVNLIYQFWVHTERIDKLPRPIELIFNTPSHHRVHHGSDPEYLDRNYAGILIIWDRLFGTFAAETHRPRYGLTTPVNTYNLLKLQFGEYAAIARDVRHARTWRHRLAYLFGPPGWHPAP